MSVPQVTCSRRWTTFRWDMTSTRVIGMHEENGKRYGLQAKHDGTAESIEAAKDRVARALLYAGDLRKVGS